MRIASGAAALFTLIAITYSAKQFPAKTPSIIVLASAPANQASVEPHSPTFGVIAPNGPNHQEVVNTVWLGPVRVHNTVGIISADDPIWHISINGAPEHTNEWLLYEADNGESWFAKTHCRAVSGTQVDCIFEHKRASDGGFNHDDHVMLFRNPDGYVNRLTVTGFLGDYGAPKFKFERLNQFATGATAFLHIADKGDVPFGPDGNWHGFGKNRIEGFSLPADLFTYRCHIQDIGDTEWMNAPQFCGTKGGGKRMEGFQIKSTDARYAVFYQCVVQGVGESAVFTDGDFCGSRGKGLTITAIKVWTVLKSNR